jgi:hypothetical protein
MSMPKRYREALDKLGLTPVRYIIDYDGVIVPYGSEEREKFGAPKIWGTALVDADGVEWGVVEWQTDEYGGRPRYYLRSHRGDKRNAGEFKTLREALIRFIQMGEVPVNA